MNMRKTSITRLMVGFAIMVILCMGLVMPVFASEPEGPVSSGNESNEADAKITKILKIAEGTKIPSGTFTFRFKAKEEAGLSVPEGVMPEIGPMQLAFTEEADRPKAKDAVNGVVSIPKETPSIFEGITWPHAGVYVYTVDEIEKSNVQIDYSAARYDVYVYVANKAAGSGLYIAGIAARIVINDEANAGAATGAKVDPTPGDGSASYSGLAFTNTYNSKVNETDPTIVSNQKFNVNKTVTGAYGDKTMYFEFLVDIDKPATLGEAGAAYNAYVVEMVAGGLDVVTSEKNYETVEIANNYGKYITITAGTPVKVNLKHGQHLVITGIHDGASYIVTETGAEFYTPSAVINENGSNTGVELPKGTEGESYSTDTEGEGARYIINGNGNKASFENEYKTITPAGINPGDLPYIVLAIIALGALAAYTVFVFRKNEDRKEDRGQRQSMTEDSVDQA